MKKVIVLFLLNTAILSQASFNRNEQKVFAKEENTLYIFNWEDYIAEE